MRANKEFLLSFCWQFLVTDDGISSRNSPTTKLVPSRNTWFSKRYLTHYTPSTSHQFRYCRTTKPMRDGSQTPNIIFRLIFDRLQKLRIPRIHTTGKYKILPNQYPHFIAITVKFIYLVNTPPQTRNIFMPESTAVVTNKRYFSSSIEGKNASDGI